MAMARYSDCTAGKDRVRVAEDNGPIRARRLLKLQCFAEPGRAYFLLSPRMMHEVALRVAAPVGAFRV
jgi:hypothetical protein